MEGDGKRQNKTLQGFVAKWKDELASTGQSRELLGKRACRGDEEEKATDLQSEKKLTRREPSPLLVLPAVCGRKMVSVPPAKGIRKERIPSFVETLISDLDDINVIPFFDVKLPREVAMLIFRHLSMSDLCTCAQVSRSWHILAEENVLWNGICKKMGYNTSLNNRSDVVWKAVVKEIVLRNKKEMKNWKERVCGLSDIQPDRDGVLVCVDFCSNELQLLAGYSGGSVYVWNLTSEEGQLTLEADDTNLTTPIHCRINNGWAAVATESGVVTVYDSCVGGVVHRVGGLGHVTCLDLKWSEKSLTVAVATAIMHQGPSDALPVVESAITVLSCQGGSEWQVQVFKPLQDGASSNIYQLALLEGCQRLLYSRKTTLSVHPIPSSSSLPPSHILTSAGSAGSTVINCFDHTQSVVACATSAWGYHVQLYDLTTGSHMTTLRSHAQPVTSVNIHNSPENTVVTGSSDRRVRVFDTRSSQPTLTLSGHCGAVISTQCDDWKVTSGGKDGVVVVWDRRMGGELWNSHERHPVASCWFTSRYLVAAHIPERRVEQQNQFEALHRCQRGLLRIMDFSVDPLYYTRLLPSICSSGYDEPSRSLHHLDLKLPYDTVTS